MVKICVRLIEAGRKTLDDVPRELRDKVKEQLIADGYAV